LLKEVHASRCSTETLPQGASSTQSQGRIASQVILFIILWTCCTYNTISWKGYHSPDCSGNQMPTWLVVHTPTTRTPRRWDKALSRRCPLEVQRLSMDTIPNCSNSYPIQERLYSSDSSFPVGASIASKSSDKVATILIVMVDFLRVCFAMSEA
jgi:hypothetical protein